ncbi:polysaccharide biosynthesis protein [Methanococcus maripaludis C5]|uniref:Polysaccharide biosynthesis protein n=1 Tax=Methanococcus maripaludis (strain C5 / ATCC BAA-1333) TaxID=402880 RepID=A4FZH5_METM5|nr:flippase [Methanococcus maripaludis]ABO35609.1 polysaccharide biosynthesis protein [Methanococcus maripaludis C5]
MTLVKRIFRNTKILFFSNVISKTFGFLYTIYMARYLGTESFGIISFALALTGMFSVFLDMGTYSLTIREVARDTSLTEKYLGNSIAIKLILSIFTFLLILGMTNIMGYPKETTYVIYILFIYTIFSAYNNIFYSIYQAHEKMAYFGVGGLINSFLIFLSTMVGVYCNAPMYYFAYAYLFSNIFVFIYNMVITNLNFTKINFFADFSFWKDFLKNAWPFALSGIFVTIYFWMDSIMISYFIDESSVGLYSAAYRLVYVLLFIPSVYFSTMYPILSKKYRDSGAVKLIYGRSLKYFAILGVFMGSLTTLFSENIISLIYGNEFMGSAIALKILIWATAFSFLAHSTLYTLNSINKPLIYTKITAFSAILNIVLNFMIIPTYGYVGASMTTLMTEFLGFLAMFLYLKNHLNEKIKDYGWFLNLIYITIFSVFAYVLAINKFQISGLALFAFMLCYAFGIIFRVFDNTDIDIFKKMLVAKK